MMMIRDAVAQSHNTASSVTRLQQGGVDMSTEEPGATRIDTHLLFCSNSIGRDVGPTTGILCQKPHSHTPAGM